jgi:hypothetical protein
MQPNPFFDDVMRWTWSGGLRVPLFFPALSSMTAVYTADSAEARRLLPDARMRPVELAPGRCLLTIAAVEYRESDLGAYNEIAIALPIAFGGHAPPAVDALFRGAGKVLNAYIWQLPVTTRAACDAGIDLAGFPKSLAEIAFHREGNRLRCTLGAPDAPVLSLVCDAAERPGRLRERLVKVRSHTVQEGRTLVSNFVLRQKRFSDHLRRDAARLEPGHGALADSLRTLRLSERPIASQHCEEAEAMLFAPRNVIDD